MASTPPRSPPRLVTARCPPTAAASGGHPAAAEASSNTEPVLGFLLLGPLSEPPLCPPGLVSNQGGEQGQTPTSPPAPAAPTRAPGSILTAEGWLSSARGGPGAVGRRAPTAGRPLAHLGARAPGSAPRAQAAVTSTQRTSKGRGVGEARMLLGHQTALAKQQVDELRMTQNQTANMLLRMHIENLLRTAHPPEPPSLPPQGRGLGLVCWGLGEPASLPSPPSLQPPPSLGGVHSPGPFE